MIHEPAQQFRLSGVVFTLIAETIWRAFEPPKNGPQGWAAGYVLGWANAPYAEDTERLLDAFSVSDESLLAPD